MSLALDCPVCGHQRNTQDACAHCEADLTVLRLIAGLPTAAPSPSMTVPVAAETRPVPGRPWGLAVASLAVGVLFGAVSGAWLALRGPATPLPVEVAVAPPAQVAAPAAVAPAPPSFEYVVRAGDSWWLLAERFYGDGTAWPSLAKANATGDSPIALHPGQVLKIPPREQVLP